MSLSRREIGIALRRVAVFDHATEDDLRAVARLSIERAVEEGGFFFFQGDPAEHAYILLDGRVKLCQVAVNGQQVNLRTIAPHQLFGALGVVQEKAVYPLWAQALEDSAALAIPAQGFRGLIAERPRLSFGLMKLMSGHIQEMQARYREMATEKVEQRLARVLLRLTGQIGRRVPEGVELAFSRQDLAEVAGTTLYTASRVLSAWEKQGLIVSGRGRVVILRPHGLVRLAEGIK